jgi:serine/threonine-protein phosphatase PP1 catalytic subunit
MFSRDQEYFGLVDKYKAVDEPDKRCLTERLRRVRRKPGLDQLGAQADGTKTPLSRRSGHMRSSTWSNPEVPAKDASARASLEGVQRSDLERRRQRLDEQRMLWERTLPKPFYDYLACVEAGET